jgi:hypothetical protein
MEWGFSRETAEMPGNPAKPAQFLVSIEGNQAWPRQRDGDSSQGELRGDSMIDGCIGKE